MEFQNNNKDAFLSLFLDNQKKIFTYILMFVHNRSDAEDILQEVASIMWQNFDKFDTTGDFSAWSVGIARNIIKKHWSKTSKNKIFSNQSYENIFELVIETIDKIDERSSALSQCLGKLNQDDREILKMRYQDGMKTKNIAEQINRSTNGIYQTMSRIHLVLQKCINRAMADWQNNG